MNLNCPSYIRVEREFIAERRVSAYSDPEIPINQVWKYPLAISGEDLPSGCQHMRRAISYLRHRGSVSMYDDD
ncbi:hypothetical protein BpHYR1_014070 [Brachionus plicatilis]|uniref:Uncharacterized protein n=1 Tax=Brachionus plicatilis TaxID=10195 RepID=A0A3M7Q7A1_BRAPC|nr:hypothetical protein BpHYR1_014070 [Brachionus plicatilis]